MITGIIFLLILGLIVFGPKKTVEMCTMAARAMKQFEHTTNQFQSQMQMEARSTIPTDPIPEIPTTGILKHSNIRSLHQLPSDS